MERRCEQEHGAEGTERNRRESLEQVATIHTLQADRVGELATEEDVTLWDILE